MHADHLQIRPIEFSMLAITYGLPFLLLFDPFYAKEARSIYQQIFFSSTAIIMAFVYAGILFLYLTPHKSLLIY